MRGHVTEKIDVFAFGIVVLETLAGRPNYYTTEDQKKIYIFEWVSSMSASQLQYSMYSLNLKSNSPTTVLAYVSAYVM
jgi:hypothetical protein